MRRSPYIAADSRLGVTTIPFQPFCSTPSWWSSISLDDALNTGFEFGQITTGDVLLHELSLLFGREASELLLELLVEAGVVDVPPI